MTRSMTESDVLARICTETRAELARRKAATNLDMLRNRCASLGETRGFGAALMGAAAAGLEHVRLRLAGQRGDGVLLRDQLRHLFSAR